MISAITCSSESSPRRSSSSSPESDVGGEVAHVLDLAPREPGRPQRRRVDGEQLLGGGRAPSNRAEHPVVDRRRRLRRELLADHAAQQRAVGVASAGGPGGGSRTRAAPSRSIRPAITGSERASVAWEPIVGTLSCRPAARRAPRARDLLAARVFESRSGGSKRRRQGTTPTTLKCAETSPDKRRSTAVDPAPRLIAAGAVVAATVALAIALGDAVGSSSAAAAPARPNIVVLLTDDQEPASMRVMKTVSKELEAQGRDPEALLQQLPPLLSLADDPAHGPVRAQPRGALEPGARRRLRALQRAARRQQSRGLAPGGRLRDLLRGQVPERVRGAGRVRDAAPRRAAGLGRLAGAGAVKRPVLRLHAEPERPPDRVRRA